MHIVDILKYKHAKQNMMNTKTDNKETMEIYYYDLPYSASSLIDHQPLSS